MALKKFLKEESLSISVKQLMMKEAFYGLFLSTLQREWTDKIPTSGVGKNGVNVKLYINEMFWESLTELWRLFILKHDILHVVFHHIELGAELKDKHIVLIASNIVVNQYIDPSWIPLFNVSYKDFTALNEDLMEMLREDLRLKKKTREEVIEELRKIPPRGVYLQDFPELDLEPLQGLKYYYDKLLQAKGKKPGKGGSKALNDVMKDLEDNFPVLYDHDWDDFEDMNEADLKLLHSQIDYQMKAVADQINKMRGRIPSELAGYIDALDKKDPPKFNWKSYLRRFTGGSQKVYTKKLQRKYNKRFEELPGLKLKPKRHVLVAVDTSGSVSDTELKEFFHEIYHIFKMGTEVTVIQCDAAISSIESYKRGMEDKIKITGRGGTDFNPPVDYYNKHYRNFSCMVYLTDGECPAPDNTPRGRLLWVLSSKSNENSNLTPQIKLN